MDDLRGSAITAFTFPQPGERQNAATIPVPIHTLHALLAAALAWEITTNGVSIDLLPPQVADATQETLAALSEEEAAAAVGMSERMMQERADTERGL